MSKEIKNPNEENRKTICPDCGMSVPIKSPMSNPNWENKAQEIIDYFFARGAVVKKEDYDFVLNTLSQSRSQTIEEIIRELGSNPNEDGSQSPNIQRWIEQKQSQLKKKYLTLH